MLDETGHGLRRRTIEWSCIAIKLPLFIEIGEPPTIAHGNQIPVLLRPVRGGVLVVEDIDPDESAFPGGAVLLGPLGDLGERESGWGFRGVGQFELASPTKLSTVSLAGEPPFYISLISSE